MQYKYCFKIIYRILKNIRKSDVFFFSEIPIILNGDFAQILLIVYRANRARTVAANL